MAGRPKKLRAEQEIALLTILDERGPMTAWAMSQMTGIAMPIVNRFLQAYCDIGSIFCYRTLGPALYQLLPAE